MSKKIFFLFVFLTLIIIPLISLGATPGRNQITSFQVVIDRIVSLIWKIFLAIAVIMFIMAGVKFLSAQGNPVEIATARRFAIWGMIGIAIAILGNSIIQTIYFWIFAG